MKHAHPNHKPNLVRLKRIKGQIAGIEGMIESQRYCPEILIQIQAAIAALKGVELEILETHLKSCLKHAALSHNPKGADTKIKEIIKLLKSRR